MAKLKVPSALHLARLWRPDAGAVLGQADEHQTECFERRGHVQAADIERTQSEALDEGRDAGLGFRIVSCDERVETSTLSKHGAEEGVERLHDMRAEGVGGAARERGTASVG